MKLYLSTMSNIIYRHCRTLIARHCCYNKPTNGRVVRWSAAPVSTLTAYHGGVLSVIHHSNVPTLFKSDTLYCLPVYSLKLWNTCTLPVLAHVIAAINNRSLSRLSCYSPNVTRTKKEHNASVLKAPVLENESINDQFGSRMQQSNCGINDTEQ